MDEAILTQRDIQLMRSKIYQLHQNQEDRVFCRMSWDFGMQAAAPQSASAGAPAWLGTERCPAQPLSRCRPPWLCTAFPVVGIPPQGPQEQTASSGQPNFRKKFLFHQSSFCESPNSLQERRDLARLLPCPRRNERSLAVISPSLRLAGARSTVMKRLLQLIYLGRQASSGLLSSSSPLPVSSTDRFKLFAPLSCLSH